MSNSMDEESWREFLQGFRHYQNLQRQLFSGEEDAQVLHASDDVSELSARDQQPLAGAGAAADSAEAPRNHDDSPGHLHDGSFDANGDDEDFNAEYEEEDSDDGGFHPFVGSEDFVRFAELWDQGSHEEAAYHFLSQRVEPDAVEQFREIVESALELVDAENDDDDDDVLDLERIFEAVADGRLVVQVTPARLLDDESYGGGGGSRGVPASSAAVASLEKQKYQQDLGDDHNHNECTICLEDYAPGDELSVMPCTYGHRYHQGCLAAWLERDNVCPLCRHALPTEQEQELAIQFDLNLND
ncbi:unnamed protein product [Urochloa decumbens]|uniref:RING-type domain-containing protein n=1 Tax=Urochloa decumbens TaxID=240449 RepID=A0ABC9H9H0_9POAL